MASENWKDVLKAQHDDLARLEALDAALNENQISDDIDKLLKRPVRTEVRHAPRVVETVAPQPPSRRSGSNVPPPAYDDEQEDMPPSSPSGSTADHYGSKTEDALLQKNAPETADRLVQCVCADSSDPMIITEIFTQLIVGLCAPSTRLWQSSSRQQWTCERRWKNTIATNKGS